MLKNEAPMGVQVLAIKSLEAHANSSIVRQFSRSAKKRSGNRRYVSGDIEAIILSDIHTSFERSSATDDNYIKAEGCYSLYGCGNR